MMRLPLGMMPTALVGIGGLCLEAARFLARVDPPKALQVCYTGQSGLLLTACGSARSWNGVYV